jgi:hypothetical protein
MRKIVSEDLNEYWEEDSTTIDNSKFVYPNQQVRQRTPLQGTHPQEIQSLDIFNMIPPPNIKFSPEDFEEYISQLIEMLPVNPLLIVQVYQRVLQNHPYLSKIPIGFNKTNPYLPTLEKFENAIKTVLNQ